MRIGIVYLGRRGPGVRFSLELASHLAADADIFCVASSDSPSVGLWQERRLPLILVPTFRTKIAAASSYFFPSHVRDLAGKIAAKKPDVVLYPMVHPWTLHLQHFLAPAPNVIVVHDPIAHPGFIHRMSSWWERRAAHNATRCVVLGRIFVENLIRQGIAANRIDVIPLGVFSHYADTPEPPRRQDQERPILFFGRITKYKGLHILLQAFKELVKQQPDLHLQIVGDGNLKPYQELLATIPNVHVINRWISESEVSAYFRGASIVALPYTSASQSGVIATAAAFRTPVIATRVGALPEQIEDGRTGLLIDPGSVPQLRTAIRSLLDKPQFARTLGQNLAAKASVELNWKVIASSFLETCTRALPPTDGCN